MVIEAISLLVGTGFGVIGFNDISARYRAGLDDRRHSATPTGVKHGGFVAEKDQKI